MSCGILLPASLSKPESRAWGRVPLPFQPVISVSKETNVQKTTGHEQLSPHRDLRPSSWILHWTKLAFLVQIGNTVKLKPTMTVALFLNFPGPTPESWALPVACSATQEANLLKVASAPSLCLAFSLPPFLLIKHTRCDSKDKPRTACVR